jgi:hypothetical protein
MPAFCSFVVFLLICASYSESTGEMKSFPAKTVPTVDTNFFANLHEFLRAGDGQCCARCRARRARVLAPMQPTRKAEQSMPRWRPEVG